MPRALIALAALAAASASSRAVAEPSRSMHYGVGLGGYAAITGPSDWGPAIEMELSPAGVFGRAGARIELRGFEAWEDGWITGGVTYEVGASRPRLVLSLHAEAGTTYGEVFRPVVGGGSQLQLFLLGPLAIGIDTTATLVYDGVDSALALGTSFTVRLAI
jgi:hypothetical protein